MDRALLPLVASSVMVVAFAIELVYSRVKRDGRCEIKDAATNCAIGAGYLVFNGLWGVLTAAIFLAVYQLTPLRVDTSSGWSWLALFVAHDLLFYWSHRASHTIGILWAAHTVHHSSPKLNLSTGMRNSWIGGVLDWPFILPLAALGYDPLSIALCQVLTTVWDFFAHTAYVPRLRWLDPIMNTPANHQVHHSAAEEDLNANFGAILIVWDRIFGTYRRPAPVVAYGMDSVPERPYNPVYLELSPFVQLFARLRRRAVAAVK